MARMKKASSNGVVSKHEYFVSIVIARSGKGDPVCLMEAMSLRDSDGYGS
jgi:hypothetical protein